MPCFANCKTRNYLIQSRIKYDWYNSTISMMRNIIELSRSVQEVPWPNYSAEVTKEKIELCHQHRIATVQRILQLETIICTGCQWCVQQYQPNAWEIKNKEQINFYVNINVYFLHFFIWNFWLQFCDNHFVKLLFCVTCTSTTWYNYI